MKFNVYPKYLSLIIFLLINILCPDTQASDPIDKLFAMDQHYRTTSWIPTPSKESVAIHEELAYSVVCAHELCEDPSSNIAAFGFSAHKSDGTVIKTIKFPLLFSSGKLAPSTPKDLDISTINERFSKTLDILSPREQLIEYLKFIQENLDLSFNNLNDVINNLIIISDKSSGIPTLKLDSGSTDIFLGYVKHCEQCFLFELFRNPNLLEKTIKKLFEGDVSSISLDILTYNDMCQRCFAGCDRFFPMLENTIEQVQGKKIPLNIFISSFRPFEIHIDKDNSAGFTRGEKKINDYEQFNISTKFNHSDTNVIKYRKNIFQFFNLWMLESQKNIERKKYIRSAIQALSDNVPFIFEPLPTEPLNLRRNTKQLSLSGAISAMENLYRVKGIIPSDIEDEISKVNSLINEAYQILTKPLQDEIAKLNSLLGKLP